MMKMKKKKEANLVADRRVGAKRGSVGDNVQLCCVHL